MQRCLLDHGTIIKQRSGTRQPRKKRGKIRPVRLELYLRILAVIYKPRKLFHKIIDPYGQCRNCSMSRIKCKRHYTGSPVIQDLTGTSSGSYMDKIPDAVFKPFALKHTCEIMHIFTRVKPYPVAVRWITLIWNAIPEVGMALQFSKINRFSPLIHQHKLKPLDINQLLIPANNHMNAIPFIFMPVHIEYGFLRSRNFQGITGKIGVGKEFQMENVLPCITDIKRRWNTMPQNIDALIMRIDIIKPTVTHPIPAFITESKLDK